MEKVKDITSLEAYQNFKKAVHDLEAFKKEREQRERHIFNLFDKSKALRMEAEMASSFGEMEKLEDEADKLKKAAKQDQKELDKWQAEQPHHGNLRGEARKQLETEGREFISNLFDRAQSEIEDATEILQAINASKNVFKNNVGTFIPSVTHTLDDLKTVKKDLNFNP